jgi:signal transduction histidine kinase
MQVKLRLTLLYGVLFLLSGLALLIITNLLTFGRSETAKVTQVGTQPAATALDAANAHIGELESELSSVRSQLLLGSGVALAVMTVVSVVLGRAAAGRALRPLRTITATTRRITADNLHERLAVAGPADEVKDLADTIDDLLERLEGAFEAQRRFVANASHELRTPLTTMRASLDVAMAKREPAPPRTRALADRLRTELDRVDGLLEGFLVLARAQHGAFGDRAAVSLGSAVHAAIATRAPDIAAKRLTVQDTGVQGTSWTRGSPALLARMVDNIIGNAVVHNRDGGWLRVSTSSEDSSVRLVVETGGPVLDPRHVAQLARPFQRLTADRTGSETGSGLGLSIVAAIATAHGGRLDLDARPEGGLRVTVTMPSASTPQDVTA